MDMLLLIIGLVLWKSGKFRFGSVNTEGRHVKAAGLVLMLPALGLLLVSMVLASLFGADLNAQGTFYGLLIIFGLGSMTTAITLAYILIVNPANAPRLPGVLGQIQAERNGETAKNDAAPRAAAPHPLVDYKRPSGKVRNILTVDEAAAYMGVTSADIMAWIERGELPAARDNYRYQIARSALDELKQSQLTKPALSL